MANLDQVRIQIVPDNFTRKALLETGDADVAGIDFKDLPSLVSQGFITTGAGGGSEWILWFAGNYWEKTHAITGRAHRLGPNPLPCKTARLACPSG